MAERPDGGASMKSSPVPVNVMVWGLPSAVSVMAMAPALLPPAAGLKVTFNVQLALTATLEPQSLVCEASPPVAMLAMLRAAPPVLMRVTL